MDPKTVLIIEDDKNIRELYAVALTNAGIDVLMAEDGAQGVRVALEKHPTVILMDITMPVMDGHEATKKIREDAWGRSARIIFLTNLSDPRDVAHAIAQKPEDYIIKVNTSVKDVVNQVRMAMYQE